MCSRYGLYTCDYCGVKECRDCGGFSASEERCFLLAKRKVFLFCAQCRDQSGGITDLMKSNRSLKLESEKLKEIIGKKTKEFKEIEQSRLAEIGNLKNEIELLKRSKTDFDVEKKDLSEQLNKCFSENDALKEENISLKDTVNKLGEQRSAETSEMENLTLKMHKVLEENKNISAINEILQRQVDIKSKEVENGNSTAPFNEDVLDKLFLQLWTRIEVKFNEKVAIVNRDIDAKITMHNQSKSSSFETYSNAVQKRKNTKDNQITGSLLSDQRNLMQSIIDLNSATSCSKSIYPPVSSKPAISNSKNTKSTNGLNITVKSALKEPVSIDGSGDKGQLDDNGRSEEWKVTSRKKKNQIFCKGPESGSNKSKLSGATRRRWIYVGKVAGNNVSEADILEYMNEVKGNENIIVKKLSTKGANSAFSVGLPSDEAYTQVYNPTFWPNGVLLREFNFSNDFFRRGKGPQIAK